jgi:hypothetical protein
MWKVCLTRFNKIVVVGLLFYLKPYPRNADKEEHKMAEQTTEGQEQQAQAPAEGQAAEGQSPSQTPTQETLTPDKFLEMTGFKSYDEAAKSIKEGHSKITKLAQEKAQLETAVRAQYNQPAPQQSGQAGDFFDDPEGHVRTIAKNIVSDTMRNVQAQQAIERVRAENPEKFEQLRPIAQQIFAEKPYLNQLGEAGLRQAMGEAEQRRVSYIKSLSDEIEALRSGATQTGNGQAMNEAEIRQRILAEMNRNQNATIPESNVGRAITGDDEKKRNQLVKDGDVDALLELKIGNLKI